MAIETWPENPGLGKDPCKTERDSWQCPNMTPRHGDRDLTGDNYDCQVCGRHVWLSYEEMQ